MKKSLMTWAAVTGGAIAIWSFNSASSAEAQGPCDRLTGSAKSRCLADERRGRRTPTPTPTPTPKPRSMPTPTPTPVASKPAVPRSLSPGSSSSPGPVVTGGRVTISWGAVPGATEYDFGIRDMTTNALIVDSQTARLNYTTTIERGKTYRWNVRACNKAGCSSFTSPLFFQGEGVKSVGAITLPATFPLYNQHVASKDVYSSVEWANGIDTVSKVPRKDLTCLAVVYAMIEHARGNRKYRVGPHNWSDQSGPARPSWASGDIAISSAEKIFAELRKGNPVILWGPYGKYGHFILAIGVNASGQIMINDPSGGKRPTVDPKTWSVSGGSVLSKVTKYRTVAF